MMHADLLKQLLPPVSYNPNGRMISAQLEAVGKQLDVALGNAGRVEEAITPFGAGELLPDWERVYGLPDACMAKLELTWSQRLNAVIGKIRERGGLSRAYFIGIAAGLGYAITITEFSEHNVEDDVETPMYGEDWEYAWQVNAPLYTMWEKTVEDTVEDPLAAWGNELLECVLRRLKPAHTPLIFSYA